MKTKQPFVNASVRLLLAAGIMRRSTALLETIGRKSGQARITPVTNGLSGDEFWIVTEHGAHADYVHNIEANPRVRVKVGRRWRAGSAHFVPDDTPEAALKRIVDQNPATRRNAEVIRKVQTDMRVIRVDLDRQ
ncbi:MAG TPA: nitroreductase/quinone reductase family protein [Solirubrobacterales bacterium]|jgi:deazaflavin-dependent oxidoreductase (nitroreductase family)|nr:nitroreductase/quinone reductase family protein [Solirubrobacterales bacterium]